MRPTLRSLFEKPMHQVYVDGKGIAAKELDIRTPEHLPRYRADTGVHVVGPGQDQDAWFLVLRAPGENFAAAACGCERSRYQAR